MNIAFALYDGTGSYSGIITLTRDFDIGSVEMSSVALFRLPYPLM